MINLNAQDASDTNALLVQDSQTMVLTKDLQHYLKTNGARITHVFPPHFFMGYVPPILDEALRRDYGIAVYRTKIKDTVIFSKYWENVSYAVNIWNKRFAEDPPDAPLIRTDKTQQVQKGTAVKGMAPKMGVITLNWDDVANTSYYKVQICRDTDFKDVILESMTKKPQYNLYPAFFTNGVYYWRVAGLFNAGHNSIQGQFSDVHSFAVSKSPAPEATIDRGPVPPMQLSAPVLAKNVTLKGKNSLTWEKNTAFKYYRVQVAGAKNFADTLIDGFTDKDFYRISGLPIEFGKTYFMRIMGSDDSLFGPWSEVSEVKIDTPGPIANDALGKEKR